MKTINDAKYIFVDEFDYSIAKFMLDQEGITHHKNFEENSNTAIMIYSNMENIKWVKRELPFRNINYTLSDTFNFIPQV